MSANLLIDGPGLWAFNFDLTGKTEVSFGRSRSNDIHLADSQASSRHGLFVYQPGGWIVRDLNSSNGTFLNNTRIQEAPLASGDVIRIGETDIVFKDRSHVSDDVWGRTAIRMSKHESAIRSALRKVASDEAIVIPDLNLAPAEAKTGAPAGASDSAFDVMEFNAERFERRKVDQQSGAIRDDMMWVAQKLADILGSISLNRFATADEAYRAVLTQLQQIVRGENGFIMIPDKKTNRWVIRAWVGDSSGWSDYEKIHPVSLTVANQAYKENRVVTNCFGEDQLDSASLQKLNVQHYVAVPLYRNAQKGGLLYFDNRTKAQPFRQRDVKLLERVGSYVLELDRVVT